MHLIASLQVSTSQREQIALAGVYRPATLAAALPVWRLRRARSQSTAIADTLENWAGNFAHSQPLFHFEQGQTKSSLPKA
ncbi:hypothetical protein SAMN05216330_11587 [Bradyrhizobium sp. Ghvi]|nr:hypothetical protein SAMN05216330_11587 [Bradyrhizobium sp. Ghvi]